MSLVRQKRHLQGKELANVSLTAADLAHTRGFQSRWTDCIFRDCRFDLSELGGAEFTRCLFDHCSISLANMGPSRYDRCEFNACVLDNSTFQGSWISHSRFVDCRAQYVNFDSAQLEHVVLSGCNFRWANLTLMNAEEVSWDDCALWGTRIALDCTFFRAKFDEKWRRRFAALLAWSWPEGIERDQLENLAGRHMDAIRHLMEGGVDGES